MACDAARGVGHLGMRAEAHNPMDCRRGVGLLMCVWVAPSSRTTPCHGLRAKAWVSCVVGLLASFGDMAAMRKSAHVLRAGRPRICYSVCVCAHVSAWLYICAFAR